MADLIDRQELLKHKGNCYDEEGHLLYAVGTGTILLMPTVDAVRVVRCKDCKECEERHTANYLPFLYCKLNEHSVLYNAFCCWGERKTDEE